MPAQWKKERNTASKTSGNKRREKEERDVGEGGKRSALERHTERNGYPATTRLEEREREERMVGMRVRKGRKVGDFARKCKKVV